MLLLFFYFLKSLVGNTFHFLLFLLHHLFVELFLCGDFFLVSISDIGEIFTELDVSILWRKVLILGEVGQALWILASIHSDGVPINKFELIHKVKHLWHYLKLEGSRFLATLTNRHFFMW